MKNSTKILIVEDEYITAKSLSVFLETSGYTVAGIANNAINAINILNTKAVDCVILDININGEKDGIWMANYLKNNFKQIPYLYLTAYTNEDIVLKALKTNPYGYLTKPFQSSELFPAIEIALYKHAELIKFNKEPYETIYIYLKNIDILEKVFLKDILFVESIKNYLYIHTTHYKYKHRSTIGSFLNDMLTCKDFIRVHRGFIINIHKIKRVNKIEGIIYMSNFEIPISNTYKEAAFLRLKL